jgi:voltage-gated potassium channel
MSHGTKIKEVEEFPRRIKIFFGVIFGLLVAGTIGFSLIDKSSLKDSAFRTLQTLAFIFEDNPEISERLLEIFLAIVGVFLIWWVLWSVADMLLDGNLKKYLKSRFYKVKLEEMRDHIIIAGGGRVGEEVARVLHERGEKFVITDINPEVIDNLKKKKYLIVEGSAERDEILVEAGVKRAKKLIITLPKTETNILITLTAKELNPSIEVHARAENIKFVSKLKKAGAKVVVVPEVVAGDKLIEGLGK